MPCPQAPGRSSIARFSLAFDPIPNETRVSRVRRGSARASARASTGGAWRPMKSRWKTVCAVVWVMVVSTGWVAAEDEIRPREGLAPVTTKLEALIRQVMKDQDLPAVSIALVEGKNVTWAKGFGMARPKERVAATADSVYRVGSVSKLFTDLALMQLVEQGLVDLDAPVATYLPDFTPGNRFGTPITLRQMMSHRSGLVREPPLGHYFDPTSPSIVDTVQSLHPTELVYAADDPDEVFQRGDHGRRPRRGGGPEGAVRRVADAYGDRADGPEVDELRQFGRDREGGGPGGDVDLRRPRVRRADVPAWDRAGRQPAVVGAGPRPVHDGPLRRRKRAGRSDRETRDLAGDVD